MLVRGPVRRGVFHGMVSGFLAVAACEGRDAYLAMGVMASTMVKVVLL